MLLMSLTKKLFMKKLLLVFAITAIVTSTNAQKDARTKPFLFSIGVEGSLPIGDFSDTHDVGIGGSVQGEYKPDTDLGLTLNAGYITYSGKKVNLPVLGSYKYPSFGLIPVLAGVKYYFGGGAYAHGQLGIGMGTDEGQGSNFMYAPGLGYMFAPGLDAELKYVGLSSKGENTGSLNSIGLRLAYNF